MCCVDFVWPVIGLMMAEELSSEDQALGGGMLQTASQLGRALGLAIATAIQKGVAHGKLLRGLRAVQWMLGWWAYRLQLH
jgi:hypothetical protein